MPALWSAVRIDRIAAIAAIAAVVGGLAPGVRAAPGRVDLPRLSGPIELDGRPDEAAWQAVAPLPLTLYAPTFGGTPTQRSEIRVAYDDEALYAAGWFYDLEPDGVRINSLYRDRWNGDDAFAIYVDAFDDNAGAKWFGTTPAAMRFDSLISQDGAAINDSWEGYWEARTTVTDLGWFAEVRIPFSTLGFQAEDGRAVMGLTVTRLVSRLGERVTFPSIDPRFQFRAPSQAQDVTLDGVRTRTPIHLTPYLLAGFTRRVERDPMDGTLNRSRDLEPEAGGDLRYALSSTLTLDLTANTDFAQVEADEEQIALDRFPLFFPEKRRFFQEGSGVFEFPTSSDGRLFHSRRIGLTDDRRTVPVLGGARLVGRAGAWDIGLLDMQTQAIDDVPSENFGVLRLRRGVLTENSTIGMMATSRAGGGHYNATLGLDGDLRVVGDSYLTVKAAGTADDAGGEDDVASRGLFQARWERRVQRGPQYTLSVQRVGADFRPEVGFLSRSDVTTANAVGNWFLYTDRIPYLRRVYPGALALHTWRNGDGTLETGTWAAWVQWDTKAGGGGWIEPKVFREDVLEAFPIGDTTIPAGRYTFADLQLVLSMSSGERLRTDLDARAGTFFDGTRVQAIVTPTWNLSRHLELGASYQITRLRFDERDQEDDIQLARFQVRFALDARASANAFVQYSSTADRVGLNVRLRYNFAEGTDLWLVYDEGLLTERDVEDGMPRLPVSTSRALIAKCTYTFHL
jgi:hypothetical protein